MIIIQTPPPLQTDEQEATVKSWRINKTTALELPTVEFLSLELICVAPAK